MPENPYNRDVPGVLNNVLQRLRAVERTATDPFRQAGTNAFRSYTWQSGIEADGSPTQGYGHGIHADRQGHLLYVRAERPNGDGVSSAYLDLEVNDQSVFTEGFYPTVDAGQRIGPEVATSTHPHFIKGDFFCVNVLSTGGGTGLLRMMIHFYTPTEVIELNTI